MRIIDRNVDFYDYQQGIYGWDESQVFDRSDSFLLTKGELCDKLSARVRYEDMDTRFLLLQVGASFWLFVLHITSVKPYYDRPMDYTAELVSSWKNYNKRREMFRLDEISFEERVYRAAGKSSSSDDEWYRLPKNRRLLQYVIDSGEFTSVRNFNRHIVRGDDGTVREKHIPLLKACGLAELMDDREVYTAIEESIGLDRSSGERTESKGLTDVEKAENHGFDRKTSFRGKRG